MRVWRIYVNACKLSGNHEYLKPFIKEFYDYFEPDHKEDFKNYCLATYYLCKNEFEKALECNSKVNIEVPLFRLEQKIIKIQCFVALNFIESFYSEADALKHYLRNNKHIKNIQKQSTGNFLSYLLMIVKNSSDKKILKDIKAEIEKEKTLYEKKWLLSLF